MCVYTVVPERVKGTEVEEGLVSLNKHLRVFGLELCKTRLEDREETWYAVVNRNPDAAAKIASKFTAQELEFFNKMVPFTHFCGVGGYEHCYLCFMSLSTSYR